MDIAIGMAVGALVILALGALLIELGKSQKNSEPARPNPISKFTYVMRVQFAVPDNFPVTARTYQGNSLEYLQQNLNLIVFHSIKDVTVHKKGVLSHTMDETGVLREVIHNDNSV